MSSPMINIFKKKIVSLVLNIAYNSTISIYNDIFILQINELLWKSSLILVTQLKIQTYFIKLLIK